MAVADLFPTFDIFRYLEDRGVPYWTHGKNVSKDWIATTCVSCGDHSNHLGIALDNKRYSCWRCAIRGDLVSLICLLDRCSTKTAIRTVREYQDLTAAYTPTERPRPESLEMPHGVDRVLETSHVRYLEQRRYDPDYVYEKYTLYAGHRTGGFKYRLVIPIFEAGVMVNLVGRDVTGQAEEPYTNIPNTNAPVSTKHAVYGAEHLRNKDAVIVVEGIFDSWRIGDGAVALLGIKWTTEQLDKLRRLGCNKYFVLFDNDPTAQASAEKLAKSLAALGKSAERIEIDAPDPDSMSDEEVREVRAELLGE